MIVVHIKTAHSNEHQSQEEEFSDKRRNMRSIELQKLKYHLKMINILIYILIFQ